MRKQTIETAAIRRYTPPVCEEIPVWAEGPLCGSGDGGSDDDDDDPTETVGEIKGSW